MPHDSERGGGAILSRELPLHRDIITDRLHPRFMAEELCPVALARHIRARRNQAGLGLAWNALEYGLTLQELPHK
ncbi:MAG TPA: hypothetical protein VLA88_05005, partial [Candidatus Saccharimonadales bacterium]|nr:hypothetical protein [Candidatus Saccharimonadales bacterium]